MMQKCVSTNNPMTAGHEVAARTLNQALADTGAPASPFSAGSAGQMNVLWDGAQTCRLLICCF